uniref:Uncharacterized protein n=1 Tax=Anguilla anguilla TaxID=7936 RepID=A0A0E9S0U9_ANGAN
MMITSMPTTCRFV